MVESANLTSWSISNAPNPCNWTGIFCDDLDSATRIDLFQKDVTGALTSFNFSTFPNLSSFILGDNNLEGQIPPSISDLSKLVSLDLGNNMFDGSILLEIGQLSQLQSLKLFNNKFGELIPEAFYSNLPKLEYLDLSNNSFTGPISPNIS